MTRVSS